MAQTTLEARQQILDDLAAALDQLGLAVACLSEAFDQLDVDTADRLDIDLYHGRPSPARRPRRRSRRRRAPTRRRAPRSLQAPSPQSSDWKGRRD
jgi:hypothetical protein